MRICYTLNRRDLFCAGSRALFHQRGTLIIAVPLTAYVWWSTFTYEQNRDLSIIARFVTATVTAIICNGFGIAAGVACVATTSFLRKDRGVLGEHTLEITDDGLVESTEVNRALHNWRTVFRIIETQHYVYVYVTATNVHIIPKNRLPIEGSVNDFLAALRARIEIYQ
jgi:hypothetical protein